jgi:hypothetical protein
MREVKRKSEYFTSHFVKFSLIETIRVNVIGLDYNLIQVLVMPISTYDYSNIS